jgi:hypothetical protein
MRGPIKKGPGGPEEVRNKKGLCFAVAVELTTTKMDLQPSALGEAELLGLHVGEAGSDVLGLHFAFVSRIVTLRRHGLTIDGLQSVQPTEHHLEYEPDDNHASVFHAQSPSTSA